jgi:hypothetical protein
VRWTDAQPDNPTFDDLREDDPTYADNPAHAAVRTALRWMIERGCEDVRVGVERLRRAAMGGRLLPSGDADTGGHREPTDEVDPTGSGWANHADIPREPVHGSSPRASMQANLPREPAQANPASHGWADHGDPPTEGVHDDNAATPISPDDPLADVRESRIRASLDRYYRAWLDRPLKDLGGRTPRTAKASAVGLLAEYLRGFESAEEARMRDGGVPYDFGWLRRELGMEKRRARKKG